MAAFGLVGGLLILIAIGGAGYMVYQHRIAKEEEEGKEPVEGTDDPEEEGDSDEPTQDEPDSHESSVT